MTSLDYFQKLEARALQAETLISALKAEVAELQKAVDFFKNNSKTLRFNKIDELSFENEKLKKEIEHWKNLLIEAEKKKILPLISTEGKLQPSVMACKESSIINTSENKIKDTTGTDLKKEKKCDKKQTSSGINEDDFPIDFKRLNIRVGKIINIRKHPDADSLYIENIDLGEIKPRTVVSGLVKYVTIPEMENRMVVALCNLKPAKMRGVISEAMVLCASTPEKVEVLSPPEGSCPGDKIVVKGYEGEPDAVLNPKKKIFEKVSLDLKVNEQNVATYKGIPFSIPGKGVITCQSLKNVQIK